MERFHDSPPLGRAPGVELAGPYTVLAEIARGDLATVYLARRHGALGLPRLCALKRLKPALSKSPDWQQLLIDEARVIAGIRHTNIVGVLGVGNEAGPFVMMEYIEGENLDTLLVQAGAARHPRYVVPPFVDMLNGLYALHTAIDDDGVGLNIVHQAPRAHHVQVGIDGVARVIDFSQMRAKGVRPSRARSDRLKVAYMAPEQALHPDGVDAKADLFIVGVSLWEALTGERLFAADTDEQTFQNLLHRRIPRPSEVGLRPPRCFDAVCMRALERDPKLRFGSAQEMARELRDTAQQQALYATPDEMGRWVRHLVGRELRDRRRLAGQEGPPSSELASSELSLETPASGLPTGAAPAALPDGLTALPSRADLDEDPYATGRIYGGSYARIALEELSEHDKTPALGLRRGSKPLAREEDDDEPTGQHAGPGSVAAPSPHSAEARARAATLPVGAAQAAVPNQPTLAAPVEARGSAREQTPLASPSRSRAADPQPASRVTGFESAGTSTVLKVAREDLSALRHEDEEEQTQPAHFVPARPGARRDAAATSPGAYSQVDSSRKQQRGSASIAPRGTSSASALPFDEDADTDRRSAVPVAAPVRPGPLGLNTATEGPRRTTLPGPGVPVPAQRPSALPPLPALDRRPQVITEHPPVYVQRRDSSPTRMEIPAGPIGAPLRPFTPEHAAPFTSDRGRTSATALETEAEWPALDPPVIFPDSLTPPQTAAATEAPRPRATRSSAVWLVSGVIAALVLLGVGVGLRHWRSGETAGPAAARPGVASQPPLPAPRLSEAAPEPQDVAPAPTQPETAPEAAPPAKAPGPATGVGVAASKSAHPKQLKSTAPAATGTSAPPEAPPVKRPAARKVVGLPDNPY